jgi:hypothetical protein
MTQMKEFIAKKKEEATPKGAQKQSTHLLN